VGAEPFLIDNVSTASCIKHVFAVVTWSWVTILSLDSSHDLASEAVNFTLSSYRCFILPARYFLFFLAQGQFLDFLKKPLFLPFKNFFFLFYKLLQI